MEVPDGPRGVIRMVCCYDGSGVSKPPVQLGRELAAFALDLPQKAHWKACVVSEQVETEMTMKFRDSFNASV